MPTFVAPLIAMLVPVLVKAAESLFNGPGTGQQKHAWVQGMVVELFTALDHFLPAVLKPTEGALETLVSQAIESALEKIES